MQFAVGTGGPCKIRRFAVVCCWLSLIVLTGVIEGSVTTMKSNSLVLTYQTNSFIPATHVLAVGCIGYVNMIRQRPGVVEIIGRIK
jgi:uncharacterized membrane-anchored protein